MSIYHLHIPRTSGIYVKQNVLPHLITNKVEHFVSNRTSIDKNKIKNSEFVGGHFGLMPLNYMQYPETFCIVRHPVERFISYFKYTSGFMKDKNQIYEKLENWLYGDQSKIQSNQQSKFLTGSINIEKFNENINFLIITDDVECAKDYISQDIPAIHDEIGFDNTKSSIDEMIDDLYNGTLAVKFIKKDGSERVMRCTLNESLIPVDKLPKGDSTRKLSDAVQRAFDLDINEWRSFSWESVTEVTS